MSSGHKRLEVFVNTHEFGLSREGSLNFRLLFVGDVVGSAGCSAVLDLLPDLREQLGLDAVVANGENSAPSGRGITEESGSALLSVVDFLTLGNHAYDAEGFEEFLELEKKIARPANFDDALPGRGWGTFEAGGVTVGVVNVLGRVFVDRTPVSPFEAADRAVAELGEAGAGLPPGGQGAGRTRDPHPRAHRRCAGAARRDCLHYRRGHDRLRGEHHRIRPRRFPPVVPGRAAEDRGGDEGASALQWRADRLRPR
jgi:hypothetical protein